MLFCGAMACLRRCACRWRFTSLAIVAMGSVALGRAVLWRDARRAWSRQARCSSWSAMPRSPSTASCPRAPRPGLGAGHLLRRAVPDRDRPVAQPASRLVACTTPHGSRRFAQVRSALIRCRRGKTTASRQPKAAGSAFMGQTPWHPNPTRAPLLQLPGLVRAAETARPESL